jgi:CHAT domain-containing protein/tetratricopeptide (TPR) repeat protein
MKGGEAHAYLIYMDTGRYAGIAVEQREIDLAVRLRGPDGRILASMDTPNARVPEPVPFIAPAAGTYRLEVRAAEADAAPGSYSVRIDDLRTPTPQDRTRVEAERLLAQGAVAPALQAAQLFHDLTDPGREADALYAAGKALYALGDYAGAREAYERALPRFLAVGREREASKVLNRLSDLGKAYLSLGETEEALSCHEQALAMARKLGDRFNEANALLDLGDVYQRMDQPKEALGLLHPALVIFNAEGSPEHVAATLQALGNAQARDGQPRRSLRSLHRALDIQRRRGNSYAVVVILNDLGACYLLQGRPEKARRSFAAALSVCRQVQGHPYETELLTSLGWVDAKLGHSRQAAESIEAALPVLAAAGSREWEALALLGLARARRGLGDLAAAQQAAKEAIDRLEFLRARSASLSMRASFLASKQDYYGFYVDLLMDRDRREPNAGYGARALAVSEQARARSLLEMLDEAGSDLRKRADPKLLAREEDLTRRINDADARRRPELSELIREKERVQAEMRRESPRFAALPQPLTLAEIQQQVVDDGTLLLEYFLGEEQSFLWAVTPGSLKSFELPPRAEIEEVARQAATLLSVKPQAQDQVRQALEELSHTLLDQAAPLLQGKRLLAVVPDGALHYIPFAALPIPGPIPGGSEPLVTRHEIVTLHSASSLAMLRRETRPPAPATLAVVADPVFDPEDPRVVRHASEPVRLAAMRGGLPGPTGINRKLDRLPFAGEEAKALQELVPRGERMDALGFDASREIVLSGRLERYRRVHFATHGRLDTENPELSGLFLSQVDPQGRPRYGFLPAHEIYRLSLPADLIVLSACQTALGREIRGEGLVGLTRGFFHAGARAVLVSLWEVDDRATAELMRLFYREMLQGGRPPAAALRAAQAALRQRPGWRAPYFWAGFVLQGDWRLRAR